MTNDWTLIEADDVFTPTLVVHGTRWVEVCADILGTVLLGKDAGNGTVHLARRDMDDTTWQVIAAWDETDVGTPLTGGFGTFPIAGIIQTQFLSVGGWEYRLGCSTAAGTGWDSGDIYVRLRQGSSYGG